MIPIPNDTHPQCRPVLWVTQVKDLHWEWGWIVSLPRNQLVQRACTLFVSGNPLAQTACMLFAPPPQITNGMHAVCQTVRHVSVIKKLRVCFPFYLTELCCVLQMLPTVICLILYAPDPYQAELRWIGLTNIHAFAVFVRVVLVFVLPSLTVGSLLLCTARQDLLLCTNSD